LNLRNVTPYQPSVTDIFCLGVTDTSVGRLFGLVFASIVIVALKSDLPQGTLDLLMLKVIALGPVHGYAIAQRLEQVSCGVVQVPEGSLYPALHRLENRGLLAADWKETETGREAKFYRLTRKVEAAGN
jgi:PadR family transcriptional regulator, regulatory protein PadR